MDDLWLLRHAQPLVAPGTCYGRTDMAADPTATLAAAQGIASHLPPDLHIVCSPLRRCQALGAAVQALLPHLSMTTDADLAEMDFGRWEGRLWAELGAQALDEWTQDFADHRPGGTGESVRLFMGRIAVALARWRQWSTLRQQPVLWIAHAGVERAVQLLARGQACPATAQDWPREGLVFGAWCRVPLNGADLPPGKR